MGIKLGNIDAKYIKVGGADCSIYLGDTKLYPQSQQQTLQWVTFNNGDTIPSDLNIYGFSGVSQNLFDTFRYGKHFKFTPSRNNIDWCITDNTTASCHCGNTLNTEVISVICSEVSCDDYYNQGATVSGTIQLYIYA